MDNSDGSLGFSCKSCASSLEPRPQLFPLVLIRGEPVNGPARGQQRCSGHICCRNDVWLGIIGLTALIYNRGNSKLGQLGAQKCNFHNTEHISFFLSAHTEAEQATQILGKQFISKADCFLSWEKFVAKYVKYSLDQWSGNWSPDFPNNYVSFLFLFLRVKWPEI